MESNLSVADALALQRSDDGMFGGQGGWFWIILILLFAGGGFGFNGNGVQDNFISSEFIKRDIFNTDQTVASTACQTQRDVLENRYTTQLGLQSLGQQMQNCCCETQKEIIQSRYDAALQAQAMQAQLSSCCCDLQTAIHAEGEATRGLINDINMQNLRDKLADRDRELMSANLALQNNAQTQTLINTLQPTPKPAYITCSPYFAYGYNPCGCTNM